VCAGPVEELLSRFRRYLEQERGLVPAAARGSVDKVRPFVGRFDGPDGLELWRVDAAEVRGFVVDVCPRLGRRSAQLTVVALRSLLRFLHLDGTLERSLAGAVPSGFAPRLSGLPKRLEAGQVDALLASCDTATAIGVRDRAILTVLARLGLVVRTVDSRPVGSPMWLRRQRSEPGLGRFMRIDSGTPRRQRCFVPARRYRRSGRCSVTATREAPRSTQRSIERR
jgi:site-specific recombinase XerC